MQFEQIIDWIRENPGTVWIGLGTYLAVGGIVLWRVCRAGTHGLPNFTGVARGILTGLFALPIWPIVWLIWVLHFRKFAPDAVDLTAYRLPVIDLAEHRGDDLRFAPKQLVLDAEIVETAEKASSTPAKPRVKTQSVSSMAASKKNSDVKAESADRVKKPEKKGSIAPDFNIDPKGKTVEYEPVSTVKKSPGEAPKDALAKKPRAPLRPSGAPPAPDVSQKKVPTPPPLGKVEPKGVAPNWPSAAVDPRTPEPPTAPPFVRKLERLAKEEPQFKPPAPFPSPSPIPDSAEKSGGDEKAGNSGTLKEAASKPDVPEIPIH